LIVRRVPCATLLSEDELAKLEALVRIFNPEKSFEAAGGLTLTEEMRVVIVARACLLVLQRAELDSPIYPDLDTIIVYPSTYRAPLRRREGYVTIEGEQARLGESWTRGFVGRGVERLRQPSRRPRRRAARVCASAGWARW
jgi:Mlc titration factor MtfA (ptsG expression regulator)